MTGTEYKAGQQVVVAYAHSAGSAYLRPGVIQSVDLSKNRLTILFQDGTVTTINPDGEVVRRNRAVIIRG